MRDYFPIDALKKIMANVIDSSRQTAVINYLLILTLPIIVFIQLFRTHNSAASGRTSRELNTALLGSSRNGDTETVKILIEKSANIHEKNNNRYGSTPLHLASYNGHTETVKILIEKGANIHEEDNIGSTPLHYASDNGHTETVKILIEKGASIHEKDNYGRTPRDLARFGPCRDLLSNERELNWLRRRSFAHVLSSVEHLWWDAQVTGREAVRTLNVSEMAREIGKYI
jgi:hypothetical protein